MTYAVYPPEDILETTVARLPLSKSIAARALVLAALTPGANPIPVDRLPVCDDIEALCRCLHQRSGTADCGLSGTALRFLTAYFASVSGTDIVVTGDEGLKQRPVGPLVDALRKMGADISYLEKDGFAPLHIRGTQLMSPGTIHLDASISSQFASALCMIAPGCGGLTLDFGGEYPSKPYVDMTLRMLEARGIETAVEGYTVRVGDGTLQPVEPEAEADWSAASYWYEIVAVTAGFATLPRLRLPSIQGDSVLATLGERIGVTTDADSSAGAIELSASPEMHSRLDLDLRAYPDLVPALAVAAVTVGMPFSFINIGHLRHKESDRIGALEECLRKLGVQAEISPTSISWDGELIPVSEMPHIAPREDHRIAMAFAAASMAVPGIMIDDPECVAKSYPGFWDDLRDAGFTITEC
ncbi:MAG: 3-phosphoshikimate 1-carboxyvinyltransferase [Muribaculaceae bacterium]|nr:3-phosphoshikimate 1-carboxyvinyltransferase [Muribaculaceae bacterium]